MLKEKASTRTIKRVASISSPNRPWQKQIVAECAQEGLSQIKPERWMYGQCLEGITSKT
jgi:hypothetical protein